MQYSARFCLHHYYKTDNMLGRLHLGPGRAKLMVILLLKNSPPLGEIILTSGT